MRTRIRPARSAPPTKLRIITDAILADISAGHSRSGDRIMSERELARQFEVSLGTVQHALQALENRGVLTREHGRGTFVRGLGASVDARYVRFRNLEDRDLPMYWHILRYGRVASTARLARFFGKAALTRIDRRIDVNGQFVLLSQFFLRQTDFNALFQSAGPKDDSNMRELISQRLALPTLRVEQRVGFERMPANVSRVLKCNPDRPCFAMELRGYTVHERSLYLQRVYGEPFEGAMLVVDTTG